MVSILLSLGFYFGAFVLFRQVRPDGIILYQGIEIAAITASIQCLIDMNRNKLSVQRAIKDAALTFLIGYSFAFTIPTTVDRSYSVQLIERLSHAPHGLTKDQIRLGFVDYLTGDGLDRRLREQSATGTIEVSDGQYNLTALGLLMSQSFNWTTELFRCHPERSYE